MYKFENSKKPMCLQLYEQIKRDIVTNRLRANEKLPSLRTLASDYKISKTTVLTAYNQLCAEGYISSKSKKGFYVNEDLYEEKIYNKNCIDEPQNFSYMYDFYSASLNSEDFPKKIWLRLYNRALKEGLEFGKYQDFKGLKTLRLQLKNYLENFRGVSCDSEQIVLCSGFSDALFMILTLLKEHTKTIALEEKAYRVAKKIFMQQGFKIDEILLTKQGVDLDILQKTKAKLLYITPAHQYFSGASTPIANKIKLIHWAQKTDSFIIEDDYDSELSYYNKPIPAMQGINNNDRVIYFGTLSKSFSPALRIAYVILPVSLLENYKKCFDYPFSGVPLDVQKTLELFIKEGYFARHIRKIRKINKDKHDLLKRYLSEYLGDEIEFIKCGCGLSIMIKPKVKIDLDKLKSTCKKNGIKIYTRFKEYLSMGFGGFDDDEIEVAVREFTKIWKKCV